ncbi:AMP-binding protein [Alcaligenaceae bacterium]|nr:AMP-binding protein [Alcaligenaceae bacterium]
MNTYSDAIDRLAYWATTDPGKTAVCLIDGECATSLNFGELDARANVLAQWLVSLGLQEGDGIAFVMENQPDLIALAWAARRAGVYYTPVSTHLQTEEIAYILQDCGASMVVATPQTAALIPDAAQLDCQRYLMAHEASALPGFIPVYSALSAFHEGGALPQRKVGRDFLYSSGTTGRPKGIKRPMAAFEDRFKDSYDAVVWREFFQFGRDCVYLTMAPLYHAAPLRSVMRCIDWGGSNIVASRFDAKRSLQLIAQYRVTISQWVPTMMVRLLALPATVRNSADLSSMKVAIHAAAPCPPDIKRRIIDWWGPVWYEYYGGSEGIGLTAIDSQEWLARPGSVGKAKLGTIHIKNELGQEMAVGQQGHIWFSGTPPFSYHNNPDKTAAAYDASGCASFGDIGHVDADGYLYISGRRTDLILSGGVNIYPQEIENLLAAHPAVADVAVIGVPHPEFGEEVKAVVLLYDQAQANTELEQELVDYCRKHIAHLKCPRSVDFVQSLPRLENGKIYKRLLMKQYSEQAATP